MFTETFALIDGSGELYAVPYSNIVPSYGVGTSNLALFQGVASKLSYGDHYVYFREGQYNYILAHGRNLSYNGSSFSGSDITYVTYNTQYTSGGQPTYTITSGSNFTLNPSSYLVYSDLGDYPELVDSRGYYVEALLVGLCVWFVFYLCHHAWDSMGGGHYKR